MNPRRFELDMPDPVESRRSTSGRLVRIVYSVGIIAIGVAFAWHFGRHVLFLEGPGIITAQRYLVSKPFVSRVVSLDVKAGSTVEKGQIIGKIASFEVDTYITNLVKILVDQYAVDSELRVRLAVSASTLESSKKRALAAEAAVNRLESGPSNAASTQFRSDLFREQAAAELAVAQSSAELTESNDQRLRLSTAQTVLENRLANFQNEFNDGELIAPISGIVGAKIADHGETVIHGNTFVEIFDTTAPYIEWNIQPGRWADPVVGSVVFINDGKVISEGTVTKVLALSGNFAGSKNSVFAAQEYGQVAHVVTNDPRQMEDLNTNVLIRMNYMTFTNFFARFLGWI